MKKFRWKKGFTLVELVIVIAVIAILAGILLPTFSNVIENAKESARFQQAVNAQKELISPNLLPEDTIGINIRVEDCYYEINENFQLFKTARKTPGGLIAISTAVSNPNVIVYRLPVMGVDILHGMLYRGDDGRTIAADFDVSDEFTDFFTITNNKLRLKSEYTDLVLSISLPADVTIIGNQAFKGCGRLRDIVLNDGLTTIEEYAFYSCAKLKAIDIPDSVTQIGNCAFSQCILLKSLTFPTGVLLNKMGSQCFAGCRSLETLIVPSGVQDLGRATFSECTSLVNVTINEGLTEIKADVFNSCYALVNVAIPDSLTKIGDTAFCDCYSIKEIDLPSSSNVEFVMGSGVFKNCSSLKRVRLTEGTLTIPEYCFYSCKNLLRVDLPQSVTRINNYAFGNCMSMVQLSIPKSIQSFGSNVFMGCHRLFEVFNYSSSIRTYPIDKSNTCGSATRNANIVHNIQTDASGNVISDTIYYKMHDGEYNNTDNGHLYAVRDYVEPLLTHDDTLYYWSINKTWTKENDYSNKCKWKIWNPDTSSFDDAKTLLNTNGTLTINEKIVVGLYDTEARFVRIADNATSIKKYAFTDCKTIAQMIIPASVKTVFNFMNSIFGNISSSDLYEIYDNSSQIYEISSSSVKDRVSLISPCSAANKYYGATINNTSKLSIENNVIYYKASASADKTAIRTYLNDITDIRISADCKAIKSNAFQNNYNITSVVFETSEGQTNTKIPSIGFKNCVNLRSIEFNGRVASIEDGAFTNCTSLTSIEIPDTITTISTETFVNCGSLANVVFGSGVTTIKSGAFENCPSIDVMIMDTNIAIIESGAFTTTNIITIYYKGTQEQWQNIDIDSSNEETFNRADLYFYSESPVENCWHYENGVPKIW